MLKSTNKKGVIKREILTNSDRMELLGCIIDVFDDFLEDYGITIENDEKREEDNAANIYGTDYDILTTEIETILISAGLLNPMCVWTGNECEICTKDCVYRMTKVGG